MGIRLPDAIVVQPHGDNHSFYVLVRLDESDEDSGWEAMHLACEGDITFVLDVSFRLVLYFLSESACGMTVTRNYRDEPSV